MKVNIKKTNEMHLHFKGKPLELSPIKIDGEQIQVVNKFKILEVWLNRNCDCDS